MPGATFKPDPTAASAEYLMTVREFLASKSKPELEELYNIYLAGCALKEDGRPPDA